MLHLCLFNVLGLLTVAGDADRFRLGLCEHNLPVFRGSMAGIARAAGKGRVRVGLHEVRGVGLMRIVALQAVRCPERLSLMLLLQVRRVNVVAVEAKGGGRFG